MRNADLAFPIAKATSLPLQYKVNLYRYLNCLTIAIAGLLV